MLERISCSRDEPQQALPRSISTDHDTVCKSTDHRFILSPRLYINDLLLRREHLLEVLGGQRFRALDRQAEDPGPDETVHATQCARDAEQNRVVVLLDEVVVLGKGAGQEYK